MPDLAPVPESDVDPRIARHLDPGETVLWQGGPRRGTFVGPGAWLAIGFCVVFGIAMPLGGLDGLIAPAGAPLSPERLLPAGFVLLVGGVLAASLWGKRESLWAYAITDRRLLSAKGDTLHRAVGPEDIRGFGTWRDAAYWKHVDPKITEPGRSEREKRYPGFHGLADADDMLRTFQDWRERFSSKANEEAAAFVAARQGDATEAEEGAADLPQEPVAAAPRHEAGDALPAGIRRIRQVATGLVVDVPAAWEATVSLDRDGPLRLFGITLLPRFIRPGEERPYADGTDWTFLKVRGAPECGMDLRIVPRPLTRTLDEVLEDPWAKTFGLEVLKTTPLLEAGGLRGFSLVRKGKEGAKLSGFDPARGPVAMRQAWLGAHGFHVEILGLARLDQPDVQRAVDAMIGSVRLR